MLLASWALLYLMLAVRENPHFGLKGEAVGQGHTILATGLSIAATLFNNYGTLALALCYIVLNKITVLRERERTISGLPWRGGLLILGAITLGEILLVVVAGSNAGLHSPAIKEIISGADWFSELFAGVAMAHYVARLQSKFLGSPLWLPTLISTRPSNPSTHSSARKRCGPCGLSAARWL